jgi:hypothetical protein
MAWSRDGDTRRIESSVAIQRLVKLRSGELPVEACYGFHGVVNELRMQVAP